MVKNEALSELSSGDSQRILSAGAGCDGTEFTLNPMENLLTDYIMMGKFKSKADMVDKLLQIAIRGDRNIELTYMNEQYNALDANAKNVIKKIILKIYDSANVNSIGFARKALENSIIKGSLAEEGKKHNEYGDGRYRGSLEDGGEKTLVDFPQKLSEVSSYMRDTIKRVCSKSKLMKAMGKAVLNNDEETMDIISLASLLNEYNYVIDGLSLLSTKFSTRDDVSSVVVTNDPNKIEISEYTLTSIGSGLADNIHTVFGVNKGLLPSMSVNLLKLVARLDKRVIENIRFLISRKDVGIYMDDAINVIKAQQLAMCLVKSNNLKIKRKIIDRLMPLTYLAINLKVSVFNLIPANSMNAELVKAWFSGVSADQMNALLTNPQFGNINNIVDAIAVDYECGRSTSTFILGFATQNAMLKEFSKTILPKLSTKYFSQGIADSYSKSLTSSVVLQRIKSEMPAFNDDPAMCQQIADAVCSVLKVTA